MYWVRFVLFSVFAVVVDYVSVCSVFLSFPILNMENNLDYQHKYSSLVLS